jgi:hypothetical protein
LLSAQSFKVGTIDIYGNRTVKSDAVLAQLNVKEGDSISHESFSPGDEAKMLEQIQGVTYATVNPVCCDTSGNLMLFIGIGEKDSVILTPRKAPAEDIRLPGEMMEAYNDFNDQIEPAIKSGLATEDDSFGYSLMNYPPARKEQNKFITFASRYFSLLSKVLKNSRYDEQREAAAQIIAYSLHKKMVVKNLLYAIYDPDQTVRNNATRALGILAGYIALHPELKISIPAGPFIKMMNSIVWTDRNKAANVLMQLTKSRDPKLLHEIKQQALPSVIEMAKWKDRGHAFYSFVILGRIAGVDEKLLIPGNYSADWPANIDSMVKKCYR